MYLNKEIDCFIESLRKNSFFDDKKIIKAYPYAIKPTRMKKVLILVSPFEIMAENIAVGEECLFASYKIAADIYVPEQMGADGISEIVQQIFKTSAGLFAVSVYASQISADSTCACYTASCRIGFNSQIDIGGNDNE